MAIIEPEFMDLTKGLDVPAFWNVNKARGGTTEKLPCALFTVESYWEFCYTDHDQLRQCVQEECRYG